jgi:hypothetical protein
MRTVSWTINANTPPPGPILQLCRRGIGIDHPAYYTVADGNLLTTASSEADGVGRDTRSATHRRVPFHMPLNQTSTEDAQQSFRSSLGFRLLAYPVKLRQF